MCAIIHICLYVCAFLQDSDCDVRVPLLSLRGDHMYYGMASKGKVAYC